MKASWIVSPWPKMTSVCCHRSTVMKWPWWLSWLCFWQNSCHLKWRSPWRAAAGVISNVCYGLGAVWLTWQALCTETESGAFVLLHLFFGIFLQSFHHPSHCFQYNWVADGEMGFIRVQCWHTVVLGDIIRTNCCYCIAIITLQHHTAFVTMRLSSQMIHIRKNSLFDSLAGSARSSDIC